MPCFLSGVAVAEAISSTNGIPLFRFSHQRGHIAAALYSCGREDLHHKKFIAFHVSGGTTEITLVDNGEITLLGGTKDISAGKAIDRIGVKLGMSFPCGKQIEAIACDPDTVKAGKICVDGLSFNLSGIENKADELIKKGADASYVAAFVLRHVSAVIEKLSSNAVNLYGDLPIIYAGGVMSNSYIKSRLTNLFGGLFAEPEFSCDNAAGIARLTELKHEGAI
jgi:N6-L-threonylcarbamoyladenine synthase